MNLFIKKTLKYTGYPIYKLYKYGERKYGEKHPKWCADKIYYAVAHKHIDWSDPKDLNEKINWLKFHEDPQRWANLADKYLVRKYVEEKGLESILIPLVGKWDNAEEVLEAWDSLPEEFILKSNNGCGNFLIVSKEKGGKQAIDKKELKHLLNKWLQEKNYGVRFAELHYSLIQNCIIAEQLLKDSTTMSFSRSMVDYKIWCFHGQPYGCLIAYDRVIEGGKENVILDFYDKNWQQHTEYMTDKTPRHHIEKPKNWEKMLEIAAKLSEGHPQVRVDLYNIDGKIYFGEMTFTSQGGYMSYFTQKILSMMGEQIHLDLNQSPNFFGQCV